MGLNVKEDRRAKVSFIVKRGIRSGLLLIFLVQKNKEGRV